MHHRPLRGAIALSLGALLAFAGTAAAETVFADGDLTNTTLDSFVDLGNVAPGAIRSIDVGFVLTCSHSSHVDPGQTVTATLGSSVVPMGGAIVSATDGTVGPVPAGWPADGASCPFPSPKLTTGTPGVVTLQAPTAPGFARFSLTWLRSISPDSGNDVGVLRGTTALDVTMTVVPNTPPSLTLPSVAALPSVEANTTGGWTADWSGLAATDAEDDPDPTANCSPAAGTVLGLGTTPVTCSVTDTGGMTASGTFSVTVVDTTSPWFTNLPADQHLTTSDPTGTTLTYTMPGVSDIADANPTVGCLPASGAHIGVGPTTVDCTATDGSGNPAHASFNVTVAYVAPHAASAVWGEPIGSDSTFVANRGRTLPIKVQLSVDGAVRTTGDARLTITPCTGGGAVTLPLAYGGGRWNGSLDTTGLAGSCHTVTAWIDGLQAGSFRLELRGTEPTKARQNRLPLTIIATPTTTKAKPVPTVKAKPAPTVSKAPKTNNGKK